MKTASVTKLQRDLGEILDWVDAGEEVEITRYNEVIARLAPPARKPGPIEWPDFVGRAKAHVPSPRGETLSDIISQQRRERI